MCIRDRAYSAAGFALVRVVVPQQKLVNGADVRLVVVDGFIERIDTSALPAGIKARIEQVLLPLLHMRELSLRTIERKLLLAGDTPGTMLRSTLSAGRVPGGSVLVV